jgi:hypothetical protein
LLLRFVPGTYMADALRQVMVAAMAAFLAILSVAAVRLFQWE